mgnify:CR=1 FL=1
MQTEINNDYLDDWWTKKIGQNYDVQPKHVSALQLLAPNHFPLYDLGAGAGVFLKFLEENFPDSNTRGVEISETAISNKKCGSPIEMGDIVKWQPTNDVKTASLIDVIEHIPDPVPLLQNIAIHTEYLLITCPNFNFIQARWDVLTGKIPFQNSVRRGGHVYWCQLESLISVFNQAGLSIVATNHLYPRNGNKVLRYLFSKLPKVFAHEFVFLLKNNKN